MYNFNYTGDIMRFKKIYLEISNICNLNCSFCPGTKRAKKIMSINEIASILPKIRPYSEYLYLHLMGEPLCHPNLEEILRLADINEFKVIITTNGTLIKQMKTLILNSKSLYKLNISLHAFEANDLKIDFNTYLKDCFEFGVESIDKKVIVYRLWNQGGLDEMNSHIINTLHTFFPYEWINKRNGIRLANKIYLQYGDKFEWPDLSIPEKNNKLFCYGLRDQIGILCDGTVVPCCLDHEGDIKLGNIFENDLNDIINSPKALSIYNGFTKNTAVHPLCKRCGYAQKFNK